MKINKTNDEKLKKIAAEIKADQIIQKALDGKYGSMRYDQKGDTNQGEVTAVKDDINIKEALSNPLLKEFLTGKISVDEEELIKEVNDNGEQIKSLDESTKNVKRKLYRRRKNNHK